MQVNVWWQWPSSAGAEFLSFRPRALIRSLEATEIHLLLDDIPERVRDKWSERESLLLQQLFEGTSVILINTNGEALAMDTIWKVGSSATDYTEFARSRGIDTNKHTYLLKCKVMKLSSTIDERQPLVATSIPCAIF